VRDDPPMRIAALYDIHGNLPALDAVLAEVELIDPDAIVIGGDVATGGLPAETIERLRRLGERARFVMGMPTASSSTPSTRARARRTPRRGSSGSPHGARAGSTPRSATSWRASGRP
jgi:3',5'-cyclic AMP phosphodiesterase CpdA